MRRSAVSGATSTIRAIALPGRMVIDAISRSKIPIDLSVVLTAASNLSAPAVPRSSRKMRSTVMPDTAVESAESGLVANVDEMRGGIGIVVGITMRMGSVRSPADRCCQLLAWFATKYATTRTECMPVKLTWKLKSSGKLVPRVRAIPRTSRRMLVESSPSVDALSTTTIKAVSYGAMYRTETEKWTWVLLSTAGARIDTEACCAPSFGPLEGTVGLLVGPTVNVPYGRDVWVVCPCS